jgi:lysophospholipase L1-like esterase
LIAPVDLDRLRPVVGCLGASATAAKGSYDWIADLERRSGNAYLNFVRFAQGGDLAYNGLQRVPAILERRPAYVVVLLGDNDVLAAISPNHGRIMRVWKKLPCQPSPEWFRECMQAITRRLRTGTSARISLCSLIPIGEDPESGDPFQAAANQYTETYSTIVCEVAQEEGVGYIPVHERLADLIRASPGRSFTAFNWLPFYRDVYRQFVLRMGNDDIGRRNGWRFHRDGIHLNGRSGEVVADLVNTFIHGKDLTSNIPVSSVPASNV